MLRLFFKYDISYNHHNNTPKLLYNSLLDGKNSISSSKNIFIDSLNSVLILYHGLNTN